MSPTPAAPSATLPPVDRFAIACEVLRLSVKPLGPVLFAQYALNCGVAALFAWQFSLPRALAWIALVTLVTVMRGFFGQRLPEVLTPQTLRAAQREHTARTGVWELAHGVAGVLLFNPTQPEQQLLLGLIIMGMTLSSAFSISFYVPATQLAITLLLAPVIATGLWLGSPMMKAVAVIGIGLLAMVWKLVADHARQLEENIGLRLNESVLREQALAGMRALEQAQTERLRFFSAANHDLRQPVMAIGLQAEVLRQQLDGDADVPTVQHTVAALSQAQAALEGLTNQLLEIGRIEAAADPFRFDAVALTPLLQFFARQSPRVRVRCPAGALVWTDRVALQRILGNLVDNALKFSDGRVLLAVRHRRAGAVWRVEVRDAGIGITPDAQSRVFEDFQQVGNAERNLQRGHGLGLSIVRRLAQRLNVTVALRSAPGRGAVFAFELEATPTDLVRTDAGAIAPPTANGSARPPLRPGLAVLVVEDNSVVADSLSALLRQWGAEPRVYASAAEALALADLPAIDLALCDIRLPGDLDGVGLAERLQQQHPDLTIALVSADIVSATRQHAERRGWHALHKPIQPDELHALLVKAQG